MISTLTFFIGLIAGLLIGIKMKPKTRAAISKVLPSRKLKAYSPSKDFEKTLTGENFSYFD